MDDYISRQTAIDAAIKMFNAWYGHSWLRTNEIRARFEQLPSADAQSVRLGRWNCGDDIFEYAVCSCCKWDSGEAWEYAKKHFKYCPNCGARMVNTNGVD